MSLTEILVAVGLFAIIWPIGLKVMTMLDRWELEGPSYPTCVECNTDIYDMKEARHYFSLQPNPATGKRSNWWHLGCAQMVYRRNTSIKQKSLTPTRKEEE